jgi:branched-chain amino acid transport system permease protein
VTSLPDVLRIPLSQPLFLLGLLFVLVVMFLPGGLAGALARVSAPRPSRADASAPPSHVHTTGEPS